MLILLIFISIMKMNTCVEIKMTLKTEMFARDCDSKLEHVLYEKLTHECLPEQITYLKGDNGYEDACTESDEEFDGE